ncbi:MAG TPA: GNAT family N-acetyltransferase [Acidimicrobiia bacterium]|jgi:hypothetical protein
MSEVVDNPAQGRFEVTVDGHTGELTYRLRAKRLVLIHTEVPEELAGHGLAGELVKAAIARAERDGLTVVPLCPYAREWFRKHPDAIANLDVDWTSSD